MRRAKFYNKKQPTERILFMDRVKTFAKYAIWLILFWILSDILIYYGINSTYKNIAQKNELTSQISVNDAEATKVNGRINGTVTNREENNLSGKYLKVDLYAESGNLLGTNYLSIGKMGANEKKNFETYFKIQDVKSYDISVSDEKIESDSSDKFMTEDMTQFGVLALLTYMIFF